MLIYANDIDVNLLKNEFRKARYNPFYKYYNYNVWLDFELEIDSDTWKRIQMISTDAEGNILGYLCASVNRSSRYVQSISAISFKRNSVIFARDFFRFFESLFENGKFHKINFAAITENPAVKMYQKIIDKYNGTVVGVRKNEVMLEDGKLYDEVLYEVHYEDYIKSKGRNKHVHI